MSDFACELVVRPGGRHIPVQIRNSGQISYRGQPAYLMNLSLGRDLSAAPAAELTDEEPLAGNAGAADESAATPAPEASA